MRYFLLSLLILLGSFVPSCSSPSCPQGKLTIGLVSYDSHMQAVEQYKKFQEYLAQKTCTFVELEPAFNELQAREQIKNKNWSLVFAPPGLAALAIEQEQYIPIFTRQGLPNERSVIVVKKDSFLQEISDLKDKVIALGTPGTAAGYYLPLYDLYGLTLAEIRFYPTPKTSLEWLAQNQVDAVALSEDEFRLSRRQFQSNQFRILHTTRPLPSGSILLSPAVERKQEEVIINAMKEANSILVAGAGYLPNDRVPDYQQFIVIVAKVKPLEAKLNQKPAILSP